MLLLLAVRLIAFGGMAFITYVALIVIYIEGIERGAVSAGGKKTAGAGTMNGTG